MRVQITHNSGSEWWTLCQGMLGHQLTATEDYILNYSPETQGRLCIFTVADPVMQTWIALKHPEWIIDETD